MSHWGCTLFNNPFPPKLPNFLELKLGQPRARTTFSRAQKESSMCHGAKAGMTHKTPLDKALRTGPRGSAGFQAPLRATVEGATLCALGARAPGP